jgi:hypothetical protein
MISLLRFMARELCRATAPTGPDTPGNYLAAGGEFVGHQWGIIWPPMGRISWPLSVPTLLSTATSYLDSAASA